MKIDDQQVATSQQLLSGNRRFANNLNVIGETFSETKVPVSGAPTACRDTLCELFSKELLKYRNCNTEDRPDIWCFTTHKNRKV